MSNPALQLASTATTQISLPLAQFAAELKYTQIPPTVLQVARHCLLDWFGVALAGSKTATAELLRDATLTASEAPQASLVGGPGRTSCTNAALINGTAGHALDYDDVHYGLLGHPTAAIAPALLAYSEYEAIRGADLLCALIAGVEVAARTGLYMSREHYLRGWHATGTLGAFGAAVAVSRAMGLNAEQTAQAMGITATQSGGLKSMFGTMCKPLHAGKAAANGLLAAQLAARGFSSRNDALECAQGYGEVASSGVDPEAALHGLGNSFQIPSVLFKYHAACYGTHASIEATRQLVNELGVTPAQIKTIEISVPQRYLQVCNISHPRTGLEAKFSLRMTCAMALRGESTADIDNFTTRLCKKPVLKKLLNKITVQGIAELNDATCDLKVHLRNGSTHTLRGDVSTPAQDLAQQELRLLQKFTTLATPVLGTSNSNELAQMILEFDQLKDIRTLLALARS